MLVIFQMLTAISFVLTKKHIMSSPNVTIRYPLSSKQYLSDSLETWIFDFKTILNFTIVSKNMSIEDSYGCKADWLKIVGDSIHLQLCGNKPPNLTLYAGLMYQLYVSFVSDSTWEETGFSLEVTGYPPDNTKLCEMMHNSLKSSIRSTLVRNDRMYPALLNCSWDISAPKGMKVVLAFVEFDIEYSGPDCPYDRVEVRKSKGNQSEQWLLGIFCGRHDPWVLKTNSRYVQIRFISDAVDNYELFSLEYSVTHVSEPEYYTYSLKATPEIHHSPLSSYLGDTTSLLKWVIRTHPGFQIRFKAEGLLVDCSIIFYDGPSLEYNIILHSEVDESVYSIGFYMTIFMNNTFCVPNTLALFSFEALMDIIPERTTLVFSNQFDLMLKGIDPSMLYTRYFAFIVPAKSHPRLNAPENILPIQGRPNTDDCALSGISFFQDTVSFDNLIGPFCDVNDNYRTDILNKLVGSTSVTYAVVYDYNKRLTATSRLNWFISATPEKCRGFQLTYQMFRSQRRIVDNKLILQSKIKDNERHVEIFYNESINDCIVVHLLPYRTNITDTRILLTGHFTYRICRRWGIKQTLEMLAMLNGSKYHSSENCSGHRVSTDETTDLLELFLTISGWTMEFMTIELKAGSENMCPELDCKLGEDNVIPLNCGTVFERENHCRWKITGSDNDNFDHVWVLELSKLFRRQKKNNGYMAIKEIHPHNRSVVTTTISVYKIGHYRTFTYKSLPGVQLVVSTFNAAIVEFMFLQEKTTAAMIRKKQNQTQCIGYKNSCYQFNIHENTYTWERAKDRCKRSGGYLVSINTLYELDRLKNCLAGPWEELFYGHDRGLIFIGLADSSEIGSYHWEDGSPLTVSDWYYPFGVFENVLPETPRPPIALDRIQPVVNSALRCVAMVPGSPWFSTNWRKVPCGNFSVSSNVYSICEIETKDEKADIKESPVWNTTESGPWQQCPPHWIFVSGHCLTVLTSKADLLTNLENINAWEMCSTYGGLVAASNVIHRGKLRKLLVSIGLKEGSGDIWVQLISGNLGCISLSILNQDEVYQRRILGNGTTCEHSDGTARHVLCETFVRQTPKLCLFYQFRCKEGTCLNPDKVCDHQSDCLSNEDESNCPLPDTTFQCDSGEVVSIYKYCNFYVDCYDGSDENRCIHPEWTIKYQYRCANGQYINLHYRCDHISDCLDNSDEESCDWEIECRSYKCPILGCIPYEMVGDLKSDCPDSTDADEVLDMSDHRRFVFFITDQRGNYKETSNYNAECPDSHDHQRCHQDQKRCFPRYRTCIYDHDIYKQLLYCSNGAHLRHCEDFQCPAQFKCPSSYCVPRHKVCDGVRDCIKGEDEMNCNNRTCPNQLRCGRSNQCVSLDYVCDGHVHCKYTADDEMFCKLGAFSCPYKCTCLGFGVSCSGQHFTEIPLTYLDSSLVVLDMSHNSLNVTTSTFNNHTNLAYLYLRNISISELSPDLFNFLANLLLLDLSDNMLSTLIPETFVGLGNLRTLRIQGNHIQHISAGSFLGLSALPELNLSRIGLTNISDNAFLGLEKLHVLSLSDNNISDLEPALTSSLPNLRFLSVTKNPLDESKARHFEDFKVNELHTDSYVFCCVAGSKVAECFPPVNSFTSCSDLIPSEFLQGIVWALAVLALVGNGGVIIWRIVYKKTHNVPSLLVLNLSIADLLMGVYLLALSVANINYKGIYIIHDKVWRHSNICRMLGFLATFSCEMSMFTLAIIALDRTKRLAYLFTSNQFNKKSALWTMAAGWIISFLISAVPFSYPSYFGDYYSRNAVCLPFNFADPLGKGWEYSFVIFVVLNALGLMLVVIMYGLTYNNVKKTQERAGRTERTDLDVARKLTLVIVTDVICVIPLTISNLLSVLGEPINRDLASVLTAFILPINSALNPYLFTFSTAGRKNDKK